MSQLKKIALLFLLAIIISSCEEAIILEANLDILPVAITVKDDRFVDNFGRQVILNGVNVGSKNKEEGYIFQSGPELYAKLKTQGVNTIRFFNNLGRLRT